MELEHGFQDIITACKSDPPSLMALIAKVCTYMRFYVLLSLNSTKISEAANSARADDTGKLKFSILNYIYEDLKVGSKFKNHHGFETLLPNDPKDDRGFRHLDTADLLCPLRLNEEFEADQQYDLEVLYLFYLLILLFKRIYGSD